MRYLRMHLKLAIAIVGMVMWSSGSAKAGLLNDLIDAKYLYPDQSTVYQDLGTQPVTPIAHFNSFGQTNYDVSDTTISITNSAGTDIFFLTASFNGVSFTDVSRNPGIV